MAALTPAEVRALASLVDELDYYQLLEIVRDAPASAVKRAYYAVSRRLHPDANRDLAAPDRETLEGVARRVSEAYQVLRDGRRRKAYDAQLAAGVGGRMQLAEAEAQAEKQALDHHMGRTPNGRRFFNLARGDIDRGDLVAAARNLRTALTFEPNNAYFRKKLDDVSSAQRGAAERSSRFDSPEASLHPAAVPSTCRRTAPHGRPQEAAPGRRVAEAAGGR